MAFLGWRCGAVIAAMVSGCAPALNWRDVRPPDSGLQLQFPCKPDTRQRAVALAGHTVPLVLLSCQAADLSFGLAHAEVGDPARVGPALAALAAAAAANLAAAPGAALPAASVPGASVPGATPNADSRRLRLAGQWPDGGTARMEVLVFARGTRVFQASVLGKTAPGEAADTFFASMRFAP